MDVDQLSFFGESKESSPLAHRMRPRSLDEFSGQEHILGEGKPLSQILKGSHPPSMLFWGPPGTGKTTLARIVAQRFEARFVSFSAVTGGLPELREIVKEAQSHRRLGKRTILFVDEIHRFNKSQQDAFLPYVEDGTLTLIGATTENPSFEVNPALLSRMRVFVLQSLKEEETKSIVRRALTDSTRGLGLSEGVLGEEALSHLVALSGGDARSALNTLELVAKVTPIEVEAIAAAFQPGLRYDKKGEAHYDTISAFIKSVRGSDPDAALFWLAFMIEAGEDPLFIARRLVILASEDIGNADPHGLMVANATFEAVRCLGMPEGRIPLAQATTYLAAAPKSNAAYKGLGAAQEAVRRSPFPVIPIHLRNAPTKLMKDMGYGKEYRYPHDFGGFVAQSYWPEGMNAKKFYLPTDNGYEAQIKKRMQNWRTQE